MKNRILACLLCVLMLVGMVPVSVSAAGAVATIGENDYDTLQKAIDAASGDTIITLSAGTIDEDIIIHQKEGVNITIKGNGSTTIFAGYIEVYGHCRYDKAETLTFDGVVFQTTEASHVFIEQTQQTGNTTSADKCYPHNITVKNCKFVASGAALYTSVGMKYRYGYNIKVENTTGEGLHSLMQNYACKGMSIENVSLTNCKSGIAMGSTTEVVVKGFTVDSVGEDGYGLRFDANYTASPASVTIEDCTIEAFAPVLVRKATTGINLTINGENEMTANNTDGNWCVITKTDYDAETTPEAPADTVPVQINLNDTLNNEKIWPATAEVKAVVAAIGDVKYITLADAIAAVKDGETVKLLKSVSGSGIDAKKGTSFTLDLGGFTYTANDPAVGSVGTANQGIRFKAGPDHTNPGNVTIQNGKIAVSADSTGVYAVINSYLNLTLVDVTIDGTNLGSSEPWVININNGTLTLSGDTSIISPANGLVRINGSENYSGDTAAVFNTTGTIGGKVIVTGDTKADLAIQNGNYTGTIANENTTAGTISISGGSFTTAPAEAFIADGYEFKDGAVKPECKHTSGVWMKGDADGHWFECKDCGEMQGEKEAHTAATEYSKDATHHWYACTEQGCLFVINKAEHTYEDGVCTACGAEDVDYVAPVEQVTFNPVLFALAARYAQRFDVLVSAENATVTGDTTIKYKRTGTVEIAVAEGYQLVDVIANGQSLGAVTSVTFKKVMAPQTLVIVTEPIPTEEPAVEEPAVETPAA